MSTMSVAPPPIAAKRPVTDTRHGITRTDDYAWLRAENWQEVMRDPSTLDADIRAHLEAENAHTTAEMTDTEALQDTLFQEMKGRIKQDDSSVPMVDGPFAYATRYREGEQHPVLVRLPRAADDTANETEETVLLDANVLARDHAYFKLGGATHSPDHTLLAWSADTKGSEYYTLRFRALETGEDHRDHAVEIPQTAGGAVWSANSRHVFYTWLDENHRPSRVYRHALGSDPADDTLVYEEADPGFFVGVGKTQSGRYIVIDAHDHQTSEIRLIDAHAPESAPVLVAARDTEVEYSVDERDGLLYILTNANGAEDFEIVTAPVSTPGRENWTPLVAHEAGRLILSHTVFAHHMVRLERRGGLPAIILRDLSNGSEQPIAFDEEAYALGFSGAYEFDPEAVRFTYSSMTTPARIYDYVLATGARVLRKEQEVPSGHDPADYVSRRIMVAGHDGVSIPVSILHHRDTPLDGSAPCLLYGYGSYGISIPAGFSTSRLSLVSRGMVFALAHIRGGKDLGFQWYKNGKREKKTNTFKDFISVADALADQGLVDGARLVAQGGSAGGMLMGAIANMRPDRWAGIIAEVPFVDVLNTMLDDTLPLTPPEWPEWGNPIASAADYAVIAAYSPYDQVSAQAYPAILAVAGLTDPRVTYWEPAKWVAKLREMRTNAAPLLLKTHMDSGHAGAAGRFDALKETALTYAFALKTVGLNTGHP